VPDHYAGAGASGPLDEMRGVGDVELFANCSETRSNSEGAACDMANCT